MVEVNYLVPKDTAELVGRAYSPLPTKHLGLLLGRFIPHEAVRNGENDNILDERGKVRDRIRSHWLKTVVGEIRADNLKPIQEAVLSRWYEQVNRRPGAQIFEMQAVGRLIVGLGSKGALETGITLHHTTGLPYIPGSALKGLCRSYALLTLAAKHGISIADDGGAKCLKQFDENLMAGKFEDDKLAERYRQIFGTQDRAGACVFHEAVPSRLRKHPFSLDVMTPHFRSYYESQGREAPHDADGPNPISYLTVSAGTRFTFGVSLLQPDLDPKIAGRAARWLQHALTEMGVGAKTASGSGFFQSVEAAKNRQEQP
ncbi:MAG: type III-B CRISPR module RAMP protein Cmr6 [Aggregatilineales bacterium]